MLTGFFREYPGGFILLGAVFFVQPEQRHSMPILVIVEDRTYEYRGYL